MELDKIICLINSVSESSLSSFTLQEGDFKLSLTKGFIPDPATQAQTVIVNEESTQTHTTAAADTAVITDAPKIEQAPDETGTKVVSPLVGTFYEASSPEADPYVTVGDVVKKGQILGIVEAMKLMNEIECECDGIVKAIYVKNGQMVEYGQPMFLIG